MKQLLTIADISLKCKDRHNKAKSVGVGTSFLEKSDWRIGLAFLSLYFDVYCTLDCWESTA